MLIIILVLVAITFLVIILYNNLVKLKNKADEGWSGISVQLKRRADLVPNLVQIVKGYAQHESDVLQKVVQMRSEVVKPHAPDEQARLESAFGGQIRQLLVLAESYPELQANENFVRLQEQLATVEDEIQMARRYYNATVRDLNTATETFPSMLVASTMGFQKRSFFELSEASDSENPTISFS